MREERAIRIRRLWLLATAVVVAAFYSPIKADQSLIEVRPSESIQAAVDRANPGDVIKLFPGTYDQAVRIAKAVYLVGADPDNRPVLTGAGQDNGIHVVGTADAPVRNVVIRGLVVQKYRTGIRLENATNCTVEHCQMVDNGNRPTFSGQLDNGMVLVNADYNLIRNNDSTGSSHVAILLRGGSEYNTVLFNRSFQDGLVAGNAACAFEFVGSNYNRILANTAITSGRGVVLSGGTTGCIVKDNIFLDNQRAGIHVVEGSNPAVGNLIADNIVLTKNSARMASLPAGWSILAHAGRSKCKSWSRR